MFFLGDLLTGGIYIYINIHVSMVLGIWKSKDKMIMI